MEDTSMQNASAENQQLTIRGATVTAPPAPAPRARITLPTEIWHMVKNELAKLKQKDFTNTSEFIQFIKWLQSLRLVSRNIKEVFDPLAFRTAVLMHQKFVDRLRLAANDHSPKSMVEDSITAFAKIMAVSPFLDDPHLTEVCDWIALAELQYLLMPFGKLVNAVTKPDAKSAIASYLIRFLRNSRMCLFTTIASSFLAKEIGTCDPYLAFSPRRVSNGESSALLADLAAKVDINRDRSLPSGHQLDVLHIQFSSTVSDYVTFGLTPEVFPPMRVLILEHYNWQYTKAEADATWDFSRLESLSLHFIDITNFFTAVTITTLRLLKTLVIKQCLFLFDEVGDHFRRWITNITTTLPHLEEFILHDSWMHAINIPVFFGKKSRLTRLELLDMRRGRQMDAEDLAHLVVTCPDLKFLKTNLDPERRDFQRFLNALIEFHRLNAVWLEVVTREPAPQPEVAIADINPVAQASTVNGEASQITEDENQDEERDASADPTYETAKSIMRNLHAEKEGVPFEKIIIVVRNTKPPVGWAPSPEGLRYRDYPHEVEGDGIRYKKLMRMFTSCGKGQVAEEVWSVSYP